MFARFLRKMLTAMHARLYNHHIAWHDQYKNYKSSIIAGEIRRMNDSSRRSETHDMGSRTLTLPQYDVIVAGGGPAGTAAA